MPFYANYLQVVSKASSYWEPDHFLSNLGNSVKGSPLVTGKTTREVQKVHRNLTSSFFPVLCKTEIRELLPKAGKTGRTTQGKLSLKAET